MTVTLQEGREAWQCIGELGRTEIKEVSWGPAGVLTPSGRKKSARDSSWVERRERMARPRDYRLGAGGKWGN